MKTQTTQMLKAVLLIVLISCVKVHAQSPYVLDKSFTISNSGSNIFDMVEDEQGNMYVTGNSRTTGMFQSTPPTKVSAGKAYVLKIDSMGDIAWVKYLGGNGYCLGKSVALAPDGHLVIGGYLDSGITSTNINGLQNYTNGGQNDNFIMKLDTSGSLVWFKVFLGSGTVYNESSFGELAVGGNGDIYATGSFQGVVDFDPGAGTSFGFSIGSFHSDIFLLKLNSQGEFRWAKSMGAGNRDYGMALSLDASENIIIGGSFSDTVDFDPGTPIGIIGSTPLQLVLGTIPMEDCYIAKYDSSGSFGWVKSFGGRNADRLKSLQLDSMDNIYTAGWFTDTMDLDPGLGNYQLIPKGLYGSDGFVQKLDANGNLIWGKGFGAPVVNDQVVSIAVGKHGHVLVTGVFDDSIEFNPGSGVYYPGDTSKPFSISGLIEFDGNGQFIWAQPLQSNYVYGAGVGYRHSGKPFIFGRFKGDLDIDPTMKGEHILNTPFQTNTFFYQLDRCGGTLDTIADTVCGYTIFQDSALGKSGLYTFPSLSKAGCDSIIVLDLTIDSLNDGVRFLDSTTFEAAEPAASYAWYNCTKGTFVPNETTRYFSPTDNQLYAVLVYRDACSELSDCISLTHISTPELDIREFQIYPNPVNNELVIKSVDFASKNVQVKLYSLNGALIKDFGNMNFSDERQKLDFRLVAKGIYMLKLQDGNRPEYFKVIKK
ncbi:T9SS type A sorting domain-containing protein [Owenweeksia hongkongensis]|uniref:T9SS type A sorting domain-containing protein n=1 Tax=Owenweeksia hongkongensis TaxID=253245 RepID=UPI003A8F914F